MSQQQQQQQHFCTNCGQPLTTGAVFCSICGAPVSTPSANFPDQFSAGGQAGYSLPYAPAQAQEQADPLLAGLAAGYVANQVGQQSQPRARLTAAYRLRGCGCLLLVLALLTGPFIGVALTHGTLHLIFTYVAAGIVILLLVALLIGMLATRGGREALADGCLDAIFGGLFGGG